jgi:hypothetical protein
MLDVVKYSLWKTLFIFFLIIDWFSFLLRIGSNLSDHSIIDAICYKLLLQWKYFLLIIGWFSFDKEIISNSRTVVQIFLFRKKKNGKLIAAKCLPDFWFTVNNLPNQLIYHQNLVTNDIIFYSICLWYLQYLKLLAKCVVY